MTPLDAILRSLESPRQGERGVLMRRTAISLTLLGFIYAELYAFAFAVPGATARVAWCGVALLVLCVLSVLLPPRPIFATTTALIATLIICVILTAEDRTSIVPLFFLWPMGALAYFHSRGSSRSRSPLRRRRSRPCCSSGRRPSSASSTSARSASPCSWPRSWH